MAHLNYHHLQYFWAVARDGKLTRAARELRVSPSALSTQIRLLEDQLGEALFRRVGRSLELTESGRLVLAYADPIFQSGHELLATLRRGRASDAALRVGAVATLSRNFLESFVRPLLHGSEVRLRLVSGGHDALLEQLGAHALDLVLSNRPVARGEAQALRCRLLARQKVALYAKPRRGRLVFPKDLAGVPMLLPGPDSAVRAAFDALCERANLKVHVLAEADDMATLRLLARDADAVALLPAVVVRDELKNRVLFECGNVPGLREEFYAITAERRFQHPLVDRLLTRPGTELLER